jgi:HEAT repeat protein
LAQRAREALTDAAWQVRAGAAKALSTCPEDIAVPGLLGAIGDTHLDVPEVSGIAVARWAGRPDVQEALERATKDSDADIRPATTRETMTGRSRVLGAARPD